MVLEKPQVQHTLKERVKSAPKKLIRRGLDDFGGDQLGDAEVSGVKRAERLAERLLGK